MDALDLFSRIHDEHLCIGDYLSCRPPDAAPDHEAEARDANYSVGVAMMRATFPGILEQWRESHADRSPALPDPAGAPSWG